MKRFAIVSMIALMGTMILPSCKKDYTCTCKVAGAPDVVWNFPKLTKKDAKLACDVYKNSGLDCTLD